MDPVRIRIRYSPDLGKPEETVYPFWGVPRTGDRIELGATPGDFFTAVVRRVTWTPHAGLFCAATVDVVTDREPGFADL